MYSKDVPTLSQMIEIGKQYDYRIEEYLMFSLNNDIASLDLQNENSMGYTLRTLAAAYGHIGMPTHFKKDC